MEEKLNYNMTRPLRLEIDKVRDICTLNEQKIHAVVTAERETRKRLTRLTILYVITTFILAFF